MRLLVVATAEIDEEALVQRVGGYLRSDPPVAVHVVATGDGAPDRLAGLTARLERLGVEVTGEVARDDVVAAVERAAVGSSFGRILVSSPRSRIQQWLHADLPHRLRRRINAPVESVAARMSAGDGR